MYFSISAFFFSHFKFTFLKSLARKTPNLAFKILILLAYKNIIKARRMHRNPANILIK